MSPPSCKCGCNGKARKCKLKARPSLKYKDDLIGFQPGHHCIVSGASGRGKTVYVVDAILGEGIHKDHPGKWDAVVVMCDNISIEQKAFKRLKKHFTGPGGVTFVTGLPKDETEEEKLLDFLKQNNNNNYKTILVIDDLMTSSSSGSAQRFVDKLFTSARHLNTSVWELNQAHTTARTRRLQAGYLICFATPTDVKSLAHICRSIRPESGGHDLLAAYRTATEGHDGHGCLVMCMQEQPKFMFRNTSMNECFDLDALPVDQFGDQMIGASYE